MLYDFVNIYRSPWSMEHMEHINMGDMGDKKDVMTVQPPLASRS